MTEIKSHAQYIGYQSLINIIIKHLAENFKTLYKNSTNGKLQNSETHKNTWSMSAVNLCMFKYFMLKFYIQSHIVHASLITKETKQTGTSVYQVTDIFQAIF